MKARFVVLAVVLVLAVFETTLIGLNHPAIFLFWLFPLIITCVLLFPGLIKSQQPESKIPIATPGKADSQTVFAAPLNAPQASTATSKSASKPTQTGTRPPSQTGKPAPAPATTDRLQPGPTPAQSPGEAAEQIINSAPVQALFEKFATFLSSDFTPANHYEKLLEQACQMIEVAEGLIYLVDPNKADFLQIQATFPANPTATKRPRFSWTDTSLADIINNGGQFFVQSRGGSKLQSLPPIPCVACTPIIYGNKVLGVYFVEKYASHFVQNQVNPLLLFLIGQLMGSFIGLYHQIESKDLNINELKKEIGGLLEHKRRLEHTASFLDKEVDRQYFENVDLEKQRKHLVSSFQKFVSPIIIERIMQDPGALKLGGVKQKVTIFFSDIRNFTKMSEKMDPSQIVTLLNEYFSAMTAIVLKYEGTLDKFVGDEVMALFGAPLAIPAAALRSVLCALEMQERFRVMKEGWKERGFPNFDFGTGLNTGEVTVGFIGSEQALSYTAIGDVVNLASRLCGLADAGQLLVSEQTAVELGEMVYLRPMQEIAVKGKEKPVKLFEVVGLPRIPSFVEPDGLPAPLSAAPKDAILGYKP